MLLLTDITVYTHQKNLPDAHVINKSYIDASAFPRLLCQIRAQAREFSKSYIVRRTSYIATAFSSAVALVPSLSISSPLVGAGTAVDETKYDAWQEKEDEV